MGFYDLAGDSQAKACALRFIGDKGPENIFQLKRSHTAAVIGNSYFYPFRKRDGLKPDKAVGVLYGFPGVPEEIQKRLAYSDTVQGKDRRVSGISV